jgi:dGTPase
MLSAQVYDLIAHSSAALRMAAPTSVDDVRRLPLLLAFSDGMRQQSKELKRFLFANLYRHPQVQQTREKATQIVRELFAAYMAEPSKLPIGPGPAPEKASDVTTIARTVADYIAGMTDRFAAREHERLTGQQLLE